MSEVRGGLEFVLAEQGEGGPGPCGVEEWARRRRAGEVEKRGPRRRKPQPARPVERGPAGVTVEEKLLDHYLGATDWANIALAQKREIVERLLEVHP